MHPSTSPAAAIGTRARAWWRRRKGVLAASAVLVVAVFAQAWGSILAETKLDLVVDPGRFLSRALDLWDPFAAFGRLQNQAVGYWFPMGPFFWVGHALGLPGWVTQRLWLGLILLVALWGFLRLAEAFAVGTPTARLIGSVAFATGPAVLIELGTRSPNVLPLALLPLALLALVSGAEGASPRRAAALSALAVLAMGGVNAAATGAALVVPLLYLLTREPGARRRALLAWWVGLVAAVTLWWWGPLLLQQRYGYDFTRYTENAAATTSFMSLTEVLRGTGFWLARYIDGPLTLSPVGLRLADDQVAVLGTCVVTAVALAGLAGRRIPERAFLLMCLAAGVVGMGAGYGGELHGPFSSAVRGLLDGPLVVLRNVHKLAPLVVLPLALGTVHSMAVIEQAIRRSDRPRRLRPAIRAAAGLAVVGLLVAASLPLATRDLSDGAEFEAVPSYWHDAAAWMDARGPTGRALIEPASTFARYRWGIPTDEPLQALAAAPSAVRDIVPFGGVRSTRLLDGWEEILEAGRSPEGWAASLARAGIGWVVVRNDLDPRYVSGADPLLVRAALARVPGLERVAGFGPVVTGHLNRDRLVPVLAGLDPIQSVEIFRVTPGAAPVAVYDLPSSVVALGGAEVVQRLIDEEIVTDQAVLLAGDDPGLNADAGPWVITDDLRRRDVDFGRVHDDHSYTLRPRERSPDTGDPAVDRLLPGDEVSVSHVELFGAEAVAASSYYSGYGRQPGRQPYAAIDGDPRTAWYIGGFRPARGQWWRVAFDEPRQIPTVRIRQPARPPGGGRITRVRVLTDGGSVVGDFPDDADSLRLDLPAGPTTSVRVTVLAGSRSVFDLLPPGMAEVALEGVAPVERVVVTPEVPGDEADEAPVISLARDPSDPYDLTAGSEDRVLDRIMTLHEGTAYEVAGTAVGVPGPALDALWRRLRRRAAETPRVEVTSTLRDLPAFGPHRAVDGDPATAWLADTADPDPALSLRWDEPRRINGLRLAFGPDPVLAPDRVVVTVNGRSVNRPVSASGAVRLEPVVTDRIRVGPAPAEFEGRGLDLVGLAELSVAPVGPQAGDVTGPGEERLGLPCGSGPELVVNGISVPTAVTGTLEDLEALAPLDLRVCGSVALEAGPNRVTGAADGALQVDSLVFDPPQPLTSGGQRQVEVLEESAEHRSVRVGPGRSPALLTLTDNENPGWVARLDGQRLRPTVVDGWRQAWVVPAGEGGVVEIAFAPGATYDRLLIVGLLLVGLVLAVALVPDRRRTAGQAPSAARRIPEGPILVVGSISLFLAAGWVALFVPVIWIGVRRPRARPVIAAGSFMAIGVLMTLDRIILSPELAGVGQVLGGAALAAAFVGSGVARRPRAGVPGDGAEGARPDEGPRSP